MLALIAGQGRLPVILARRLAAENTAFRVFELAGFSFENPDGLPVNRFRIEHLGSLLDRLVADGFAQVCFAASIRRPEFNRARVDTATETLLESINDAFSLGDDGALKVVLSLFEARGIEIVSAQGIAPELLPDPGVLSRRQPDPDHLADAARGWRVSDQQGVDDSGQASVIVDGQVIAQEDEIGTDALLAGLDGQVGGILFKAAKPGQDRRVDLPTIGPETVAAVARAGLDGIVIEAGGLIVLDLVRVVQACDDAGLFLSVLRRP